MYKLKLKSIYKFRKSCSSSHIEHNKIGFAIFGFFYDLIWILQFAGPRGKEHKNLIVEWPLKRFESLHKSP
jgi:hypothetical protein